MSVNYQYLTEAVEAFRFNYTPETDRKDWIVASRRARSEIATAIRQSNSFRNLPTALEANGSLLRALRYVLAPPLSQDRMDILCPAYSKSKEKSGKGYDFASSIELSDFIISKLEPSAAAIYANRGAAPVSSLRTLLNRAGALIASQELQTVTRNRLSSEQEEAALAQLAGIGFHRILASRVNNRANLKFREVMHKAKLAISDDNEQEVDIAIGMREGRMLGLECKVSNDATNSVKRVNDVLEKQSAWRSYWGHGVLETGALLQGVFSQKSIKKLEDRGVRIFWSHRIEELLEYVAR